jgi:general stress protein CsbA
MSYDNDPLVKYGRSLAGVLIAVVLSVLIAAVIGGSLPLDYSGRAWVYTALVVYVAAGGFVLFRLTAGGEQGGLTAGRVLKWTASLWIWPLFLLRRR